MPNRFSAFYSGDCTDAYRLLGCHRRSGGFHFAVWAPNAAAVSVVGDFNDWTVGADPMTLSEGIWQRDVSSRAGDRYKFAVTARSGETFFKSDPYAFFAEVRPRTASVVFESDFHWTDEDWREKQAKSDLYRSPVNIYEVHLGSWKRHADGRLYSYRDLADSLVAYVKEMKYTHVEFLPLAEHPLDASWGYQVTGFYAPTSRFGDPDELRYLVNAFHQAGIGVLLDWVPAHFCKDAHGLIDFDGTCCYESADDTRKENKGWGTRVFDYSRYEVQSFLISNAVYWLNEFHFDGLRVDAVASMLYLDYDKKEGEWKPNKFGGNHNLEAIDFLRKLSKAVFTACPYALFVAEESTAFPQVTAPTYAGGLGFNFKWNMGWMNDVLSYMKTDTLYRVHHHDKLTFSMCYAYSENYILPLSHDEVVHMKGSLINKMFGPYDVKFAQLKTLLGYQYAHPGKKLNFMGGEFAQWNEWSEAKELDWILLSYPKHDAHRRFVQQLNETYLACPPLYRNDENWQGFKWLVAGNAKDSVLIFERLDEKGNVVLVVLNFSLADYSRFGFFADVGEYDLLISSEREEYGGRGEKQPRVVTDEKGYAEIFLPASSVRYYYKPKRRYRKKSPQKNGET